MIERNPVFENAVEIKSTAHKVRVKKQDDNVMFAACDIVAACGIKAPSKWVKRAIKSRPDIEGTVLEYPLMTSAGLRRIKMVFVNAKVALRMVESLACPDETKKWIVDEVLTFREDANGSSQPSDDEQVQLEETVTDELDLETTAEIDLNKMIDSILFDLIELKKCIANGAAD